MDNLVEKILEAGRRIADGEIPKEDAPRIAHELQQQSGLSRKKLNKLLKRNIHKLDAELSEKQRQVDVIKEECDVRNALLDAYENGSTTAFFRQFQLAFPDIWAKVSQRIYKHTENYCDYRWVYLEWGWALALQQWKREGAEVITDEHQRTLDAYDLHKQHNFPFFFVSSGICDAAWQSDLKFTVDWKSMHLPFEAFTFVLPQKNPLGYEALSVHRFVRNGDVRLVISALGASPLGKELVPSFPFKDDGGETDATVRWVFNTIYAMSARPEYVEGGERSGVHKKSQSEIWTPNVVGRKYAVKSHTFSHERTGSVRLHWRRGHFRQQAYGIGRLQHKVIWIEPMMVGGKSTFGNPATVSRDAERR